MPAGPFKLIVIAGHGDIAADTRCQTIAVDWLKGGSQKGPFGGAQIGLKLKRATSRLLDVTVW
jgi:hypothetical protein